MPMSTKDNEDAIDSFQLGMLSQNDINGLLTLLPVLRTTTDPDIFIYLFHFYLPFPVKYFGQSWLITIYEGIYL